MKKFLEKIKLLWWRRAYKKIWHESTFKNNISFSTETLNDFNLLNKFIYNNLQPNSFEYVLDVGCGNGNLGKEVFKKSKILVQTDFAFEALKLANINHGNLKKIILQADASCSPFKNNKFDCVFLYGVIMCLGSLENAKAWIRNALNLINENGIIYIGDVPIKRMLFRELKRKIKKIRTLSDIKYYIAEFLQVSFSLEDFLDIKEIGQLRVFPQPEYFKFSTWRVDILIKKIKYES